MVQTADDRKAFDILNAEKQPGYISVRYPSLRILTELFTRSKDSNTFNNKYSILSFCHSHRERGIPLHDSLDDANRIETKAHALLAVSTNYKNKQPASVLINHLRNKFTPLIIYNHASIVYGVNVLSATQKWKQEVDPWPGRGDCILNDSLRCFQKLACSPSVDSPFVSSTHRKSGICLHEYIKADKEREVTSMFCRVKEGNIGAARPSAEESGGDYINLPTYLLFGPTLQKMSRSLFPYYWAKQSTAYLVPEKTTPGLRKQRSSSKSRRDGSNLQSKSQPRETFSGLRIFLEDILRNSDSSCLSVVVPGNRSSDKDSERNEVVQGAMNPKTEKSTDDCNSTGLHSASIYTNQRNENGKRKIDVNYLEIGCRKNTIRDQKYPKYENILTSACTKIDKLLYALGYSASSPYPADSKILCFKCSSQEAPSRSEKVSSNEREAERNMETIFENLERDRNDSNCNHTDEKQELDSVESKALDVKVSQCSENVKLSSDSVNGDKTSFLQTGISSTEDKLLDSSSADKSDTRCNGCSFCPGSSWRSVNYSSTGCNSKSVGAISFYFRSGDNEDVSAGKETKISSWKLLSPTNSPIKYGCTATFYISSGDDEDMRHSIESSASSRKESLSLTQNDRVSTFYNSSGDGKKSKSSDEINVSANEIHSAKCVLRRNWASACLCNSRIGYEDLQMAVESSISAQQTNWPTNSVTERIRSVNLQTSKGEKGDSQSKIENVLTARNDVSESDSLNLGLKTEESHQGFDQKTFCRETRLEQGHNDLTKTKSAPVNGSLKDETVVHRDFGTKIEIVITKRSDSVRKHVDWSKGDFYCPWSLKKYTCFNYHSDVSNRSKVLIDVQMHDIKYKGPTIDAVNHTDPEESTELRRMETDEEFYNIGIPELSIGSVYFLPDEHGSERVLGKGTYGTVYMAEMMVSGRLVVVKEFESEFQVEAEVLKEARILLHLEVTGFVPKLFGLIRGETLSLVQEFVANGVTLHSLIKGNHIRLPCRRWLSICQQMALGLHAIHSKHILHNDIKTDNIIVDFLKNDTPIKYIDFGLSTYQKGFKFCAPNGYLKHYEYLAPEVCRSQHTTVQSEIYSLGYCYKKIAEKAVPLLLFLGNDCMNYNPEKRPTIDLIISKIQGLLTKTRNFKTNANTQWDKYYN